MKTGIFAAVLAAALTFIMPAPVAANDPAPVGLKAACELGAPVVYLDLRTFVDIDLDTAGSDDIFVEITQLLSVSRPMGFILLDKDISGILDRGSLDEAREYLKVGMYPRWETDLRLRVNQTMAAAAGGQNVRDAAQAALNADAIDPYLSFLNTGQHVAREKDYRALAEGAQSTGGLEVKKAATAALAGKFEDVRVFLCSGWIAAHELDLAATPSPSPSETVAPTSAPAAAELAKTGSDTTGVALAGLVLVAAGASAIVLARKRARRA